MNNRNRASRGRLPKIQTTALGQQGRVQTKIPKLATDQPPAAPAIPRRPLQGLRRHNLRKTKSSNKKESEEIQKKTDIQRKPLYDRLVAILSKDRASDVKTVDAELQLVALHDDPADMEKMTKDQLDELARLALEAETYQATLLAASVIEQMAEGQENNPQPHLNDAFLRYLLAKLREQRNWQRLLDMEGDHLMIRSWEADLLLQAYAAMVDKAFSTWLVRCKNRILVEAEDSSIQDQDLYDSWIEFWSMFFHVLDRYSATVAVNIGLDAFSISGLTEDARLRFLDDLLRFLARLEDDDDPEMRRRASRCFDIYGSRLAEAVTACVKADYEAEGSGNSAAHFDELLSALTENCLQSGPKLLGRHEADEEISVPVRMVNAENVGWKTQAVVLRGLLTAFETVQDYQQHPMDPVVKPNISDMFEKILFQVEHICAGEHHCRCYSQCGDPQLVDMCELFICDTVADRYASDFAPHIDAFVAHYRGVPNDRWMRALLTVYPSAKREVTKYFAMFADMETESQRFDAFHDWRPIALSLMVKISSDNAKLFDAKLIRNIESIFFSKKSTLSSRALHVLRNVAANHPRAMLGCGKYYYAAAAEMPGMDVPPMDVVNEILRNIGLQSEEEAERVIELMEKQVRHSQDKPFIEDVLRQWHYLAIVFHEPVEARRSLIDEYRQDPLLCKAAYEVFALATGQQTKATACSIM